MTPSRPGAAANKFILLPIDLVKLLLVYLKFEEIYRFIKISKKYHKISNDEKFWIIYTKSRKLPTTIKDLVLLNYLGYSKKEGFEFSRKNDVVIWHCCLSPLKEGSIEVLDIPRRIEGMEEITYDVGILSRKDRRKIIFREAIKLRIPHKGRLGKLQNEFILFCLEPNTPVGSTLEHVFTEIYRKIYDLTDDEIVEDLDGIVLDKTEYLRDITYDRNENIYIAKTRID